MEARIRTNTVALGEHAQGFSKGEDKMNVRRWSMRLGVGAATLTVLAIVGSMAAEPVWAQVRAALVRDVDAPALAPVSLRASFSFNALNNQALLTTVPAGKRLVIDNISYSSGGVNTGQLVFVALRSAEFGPLMTIVPVNPPHAAASSGFTLQDASIPTTVYFEAGQEVWLSASRSTGSSRTFEAYITGHYVTP